MWLPGAGVGGEVLTAKNLAQKRKKKNLPPRSSSTDRIASAVVDGTLGKGRASAPYDHAAAVTLSARASKATIQLCISLPAVKAFGVFS